MIILFSPSDAVRNCLQRIIKVITNLLINPLKGKGALSYFTLTNGRGFYLSKG